MRDDDGHVGEVGGHFIEVHGVGVVQFQAAPAAHSGADAAVTAVEQGGQSGVLNDLVQAVGHTVVGLEFLQGGVEFEALDAVIADESSGLAHTHDAPVRVDGGEGHHDVAVLLRGLGHFLVGDADAPGADFRVHREHHQADVSFAVVGDRFGDGGAVIEFEVFLGRVVVGAGVLLVVGLAAGAFGVRVNIDGDEFTGVHGVSSGLRLGQPSHA